MALARTKPGDRPMTTLYSVRTRSSQSRMSAANSRLEVVNKVRRRALGLRREFLGRPGAVAAPERDGGAG